MTWCAACETDDDVVAGRCALCGESTDAPDTAAAVPMRYVSSPKPHRPAFLVIALIVAGAFVALAFVSVLFKVAVHDPSTQPTVQFSSYVDVPD